MALLLLLLLLFLLLPTWSGDYEEFYLQGYNAG
jgi:hypothetical protein